jgi:iron complex outermembrane receptor protein
MVTRFRPIPAAIAVAFSAALPAWAEPLVFEPVVIRAAREIPLPADAGTLTASDVEARRAYVSDTAQLLSDVPGLSFYGSGGVSSLPVIRGLNDDRIRIQVDGMDITSACGNHMNPPLSYIDPANVGRATVVAGITPVSLGGDSIAGTIIINSKEPAFAKAGQPTIVNGSLSGFYRSNGNVTGFSASATAASDKLSVSYTGATVRSDNYKSGDGNEVKSTQYESTNHALSFAARGNDQLVVLNIGQQHIPRQGYPNAWMDMVKNDADFANIRFESRFGWGKLEAKAYYEHTRHEMNFLKDKLPGSMPMNTDGKNAGFVAKADVALSERDTLRIGSELQYFKLNDWWPPVAGSMMMGPGTFDNIKDGRRDRAAVFGELESQWNKQWSTLVGIRYERVNMDTGNVAPYNTMDPISMGMGMPMANPDAPAALAFNALDHRRTDNNVDVTLMARYTPDQTSSFEAGYAQKTRSPNLYERFAWGRGMMAMAMNGWFGDGNGYVGNINLKPEIAHTLSATASWHDAGNKEWYVNVTPYTTYVKDYIDVDRCLSDMMGMGCPLDSMMAQGATNNFVYLQFANHDARLYGIEISAKAPLGSGAYGQWTGRGVIGYVHGKNVDTGESLYHLMPLNARLAIDHQLNQWSSSLEFQLVAEKSRVAATRNETTTAGYGIVNLRTSYEWKVVRLDAGIENLFDKAYDLPLGGAYIGEGSNQAWGNKVAGAGRSAYLGLTVKF